MVDNVPRGMIPVDKLERSFEHYGIPEHPRKGLAEYVLSGRPVGGFLRSCLENNFVDAICRAGVGLTLEHVRAIAKWLFNEAPPRCWGSPGVVKTWRGE